LAEVTLKDFGLARQAVFYFQARYMEGTELGAIAAAVAEIPFDSDYAHGAVFEGLSGADIDANCFGTMQATLCKEEPSEVISPFILYELDTGPRLG
jgi:hypothetical protein